MGSFVFIFSCLGPASPSCMKIDKIKLILYADDTNIFIQNKDLNQVENILNEELLKVNNWIMYNKLTLNNDKIHCILYCSSNQPRNVMNNSHLTQVYEIKFLGIMIDTRLTWKSQTNFRQIKFSRLTEVMYDIQDNLSIKIT